MPRIIEVIVSPTGDATVQTKGYAGGSCVQASQFLKALGAVTNEIKTAEFYQAQEQQQQVRQ